MMRMKTGIRFLCLLTVLALACCQVLTAGAEAADGTGFTEDLARLDGVYTFVRAGGSFAYALDANGTIWAWGDNVRGQAGVGDHTRRFSPVASALNLDGTHLKDIECGNENALFLMDDGTVYTCGNNNYGQQARSNKVSANLCEPTLVEGVSDIVQIATGFGQCLARTSDGHVYSWGRNSDGQLGRGKRVKENYTPALIEGLENVTDIICGGKFCLAMTADGTIYGWGANDSGQLGDITKYKDVAEPTVLSVSGRFVKVAAGGSTSFGIDADGNLWSWGKNDHGQMGVTGIGSKSQTPCQVIIPDSSPIVELRAYNAHTAVLLEDGSVYQWGRVTNGQLGIGHRNQASTPQLGCPSQDIVNVAVGSSCTYEVTAEGKVYAAGYNAVGQTGAKGKSTGYETRWLFNGLNILTGTWLDLDER